MVKGKKCLNRMKMGVVKFVYTHAMRVPERHACVHSQRAHTHFLTNALMQVTEVVNCQCSQPGLENLQSNK